MFTQAAWLPAAFSIISDLDGTDLRACSLITDAFLTLLRHYVDVVFFFSLIDDDDDTAADGVGYGAAVLKKRLIKSN